MRRAMAVFAGLALAAFIVIMLLQRGTGDKANRAEGVEDAERQRVRDFWATFNRASSLRSEGKFAEAAELYGRSATLNPRHEDSLYYLGTSLQELGAYQEAAEVLRKLVALNPASSRAHSQLGNTLAALAPGAVPDFDAARQAFLRSVEINREEAGPFLRLGLLELNHGKFSDALEHFRVAAGFASPEGLFWAGYTCLLLGRDHDAAGFFTRALDIYSHERSVTARGVLSEGDVLPAPGKPLTALERSGLKSLLFLYWTAQRRGGYAPHTAKEFRIQSAMLGRGGDPPSEATGPGLPLRVVTSIPSGGRGAWGDYDGDGEPDLVVAGRRLALYRNRHGRLLDTTSSTGLSGVLDAWDALWVDADGDGHLDLYVLRSGYVGSGRNQLFRNNGGGQFTDITAAAGLSNERSTARACFADFDGDGRLDLVEVGARSERHGAVRVFRNVGSRFTEQAASAGLVSRPTAVDCAVGDFDGDDKVDFFILHWKSSAVLYANRGNFRFEEVTKAAGLAGVGGRSFSAAFFDFDNDSRPDLLVSTQAPLEEVARSILQPQDRSARYTPRLFRNTGRQFAEVTQRVGLHHAYGTMQAVVADFDRDGWQDVLLVNGGLEAARLEPSVILRNVGGGSFAESAFLPSLDHPANFLGGATMGRDKTGKLEVYLAPNPIVGSPF